MGPIRVAAHLAPFLPADPLDPQGRPAVSAARWCSASILVIPWMYCRMLGAAGLTRATEVAILNANWMAQRLHPYFPVLYRSRAGLVAHECIVDLRDWKAKAGIGAEDVAKRLIDYGFHAPTLSFPVVGTLMIEPTESESPEELERFCTAMIAIHGEMTAIAEGRASRTDNVLLMAPHPADEVAHDAWAHPYPRQSAAFPMGEAQRQVKFWPVVARVDNAHGDRNLICSCPPMTGA